LLLLLLLLLGCRGPRRLLAHGLGDQRLGPVAQRGQGVAEGVGVARLGVGVEDPVDPLVAEEDEALLWRGFG
jgi:hypothetical protein